MKDIYKWWSRKKLKGEILNLKFTYDGLFDDMLKTQKENNDLRRVCFICNETNIHLTEEIKVLRKELNERSYVALEDQLIKAKEIIKELLDTDSDLFKARVLKAEQFLNSEVEK